MKKLRSYFIMINCIAIATAVMLLVSCATLSQTDLLPEQAKVIEVITCPGIGKDRLFVLANSWTVDSFVSADSVIEFNDKEAGIIKGKYVTSFGEGVYTFDLRSTLTIEVKDGAARITIADPYVRATSGLGETYTNTTYRQMQSSDSFNKNCKPRYDDLIRSFKVAIQKNEDVF